MAFGAAQDQVAAERDKRQPYPLSWEEQERCSASFPTHLLAQMALFAVNTGCRDARRSARCGGTGRSRCPQLGTSVFIVPASRVKNGDERLVVLNEMAMSVVAARRGINPTFVFTYKDQPDHAHADVGVEACPACGRSYRKSECTT